jgi:vacuolar protein sorting-associated protein 35
MEQNFTLVARVIHLISDSNIETFCKMLITARKYLGQGIPGSLSLTLPPLLARSFQLAQRVYKLEQEAEEKAAQGLEKPALPIRVKRVLHFIHETLQIFTQYDANQGLRLYIQAALVSDQLHMEPISYEFVAQSFLTYEERISDSKTRLQALLFIMSHLPLLQNWSAENYDNISQACFRHANAYMIKTDQARCIANCAHLHWIVPADVVADTATPIETKDKEGNIIPQRHADKVMAYIRKALAIARDCSGHQTTLFLDMLNKCIYFYLQRCPSTELDHIVGLLDLIITNVVPLIDQGFGKPSKSSTAAQAQQNHATLLYFKNTVQYMIQSDIIKDSHSAADLITQIHRE